MRAIYIVCMIALLGAMMVTPASAMTWYVHDGESIWDTINGANDGDTVFVYNGTYGVFAINTPNITLKGEGADVVTVDCGGTTCAIGNQQVTSAGCIVDGFKFVNSNDGINVEPDSPDCIIRNCVFEGLTNEYALGMTGSNTTFVNNVVLDSQGAGHIVGENCIYMNNVITGGTSIYASVRPDGNSCKFINNTITNGAGAGMLFYGSNAVNNIITKNNISSNAKGFWLYNTESNPCNEIYLNNIVDNGISVSYEYGSISYSTTYWNSTESIEYTYNSVTCTDYLGNYWGSDYTGTDANGDGIGDTSYNILGSATDKDHHPLMSGFENYVSEEETTPTPATPFLISGNVTYTIGSQVLDPAVTVTNLATGEHFTVKTAAGSNYYLTLTDSTYITAGDTIRINASDGTVSSETDHPVTASDIETGGFVQDMLLEAGDRPDLTITEKSEDWGSLKDRTYTVTYTVENIGGDGAGISTTSIKIDGVEETTDSVPALQVGENYTGTVGPFTLSGENDTIEICTDSADIINELDDLNNCLENVLEAPGMPDLIVWVALKTPGYVNEDNILSVRVKNIGTEYAGSFNVSLAIDGTSVPEQTVPSLPAGETAEIEYAWMPAELGGHALSATVDTNDEVLESNETNNDLARTSVIIKRTDWYQFHYDIVHTGFSPSGAPDTNETLWISDEISAIGGTSTVVADGKVFAYSGPTGWSSGDGALYCLDQFTGNILWNVSIPTPAYGSWSSPAYHNGRVFTSTDIETGCYDAATGEQIWVFENPTGQPSVNGGPVVADGKVIVNDWQAGHFYCLNEETGELLWTFTEEQTGGWGVGYAQGVPAYEDEKFYLTTWLYAGGNVYCVDADTGTEIWNKTFSLDTCGSPVVVEGTVYVSTYDFYGTGEIYALNAGNGDVLWQRTIQRSDSTPTVAYGNVYVTGGCKGYSSLQTYCFNATTGDLVWSTDADDEIGEFKISVAVADSKVFVGRAATFFEYAGTVALDAFTGDVIWSYPEGGSSPAVADDIVFTIGGGRVYAFRNPLPDLTVAAIETPANLRNDVINPISATIANIGALDAENFDVSLEVDGTQVDTATIARLAAGENATVELLWTPDATGDATLTVTADASDSVEELDETNNDFTETVNVLEKLTVTANVRIEGKNDTIWCGDVTLSSSVLTASDGSIHYLNEPTALGALDEANEIGEFGYVLDNGYWGLYVSEINFEPPIDWDGWMYRVNYASPWVGAADYTLADDDKVLWYFGAWTAPPLTIELNRTTVMTGEAFVVTVTAESELVDNATVYANELTFQTGPDGKATLAPDTAGNYTVYADKGTWADYTRSEKETVTVVMPAGVKFDLKKLNLNSSGILKAFITLPEGYDVADIDVSTVECEGAHAFGDGNVIPGKQALEVKFKIQDLVDVPTGDVVSLSVTGELTTGERFEGSNTVKVIAKGA